MLAGCQDREGCQPKRDLVVVVVQACCRLLEAFQSECWSWFQRTIPLGRGWPEGKPQSTRDQQ
jgi:hypothetical protein